MSVSILKLDQTLIATLQGDLIDEDLQAFQYELARRVGDDRCSGVVIDVSLMEIVDSFAARTLSTLSKVCSLRGARTVMVGLQPEVAFTMVQQGLTLQGIPTALNLEAGLTKLKAWRDSH